MGDIDKKEEREQHIIILLNKFKNLEKRIERALKKRDTTAITGFFLQMHKYFELRNEFSNLFPDENAVDKETKIINDFNEDDIKRSVSANKIEEAIAILDILLNFTLDKIQFLNPFENEYFERMSKLEKRNAELEQEIIDLRKQIGDKKIKDGGLNSKRDIAQVLLDETFKENYNKRSNNKYHRILTVLVDNDDVHYSTREIMIKLGYSSPQSVGPILKDLSKHKIIINYGSNQNPKWKYKPTEIE